MAETEKITINVDVVDLGKIDLLVEQGFYSTRTDLIKTAIRNELEKHHKVVQDYAIKKSYGFGILKISKKELEKAVANGEKLDIKVIGMLVVDDEIEADLAKQAIASLKVHGAYKAKPAFKALF